MSINCDRQNTIDKVGIGLRSQHYSYILENLPEIDWFEVLSDNYFMSGGLPLYYLEQIREHYPVTLHGVGMSLGSTDTLNIDYLTRLKSLITRVEPVYVSDHLSWISVNNHYLHDLIPLPYTEENMAHLVQRITQVQEFLGRQILIENPSAYISFTNSTMTEGEFLQGLLTQADCYLLLDVNNLYVSAVNFNFDPIKYLQQIPKDRVKQIHLAGYEEKEDYLFDTHGYPVHPPVWELYKIALQTLGIVPTLIEWDTDIPEFEILMAEANQAKAYQMKCELTTQNSEQKSA
jgi:hypothetical protein